MLMTLTATPGNAAWVESVAWPTIPDEAVCWARTGVAAMRRHRQTRHADMRTICFSFVMDTPPDDGRRAAHGRATWGMEWVSSVRSPAAGNLPCWLRQTFCAVAAA